MSSFFHCYHGNEAPRHEEEGILLHVFFLILSRNGFIECNGEGRKSKQILHMSVVLFCLVAIATLSSLTAILFTRSFHWDGREDQSNSESEWVCGGQGIISASFHPLPHRRSDNRLCSCTESGSPRWCYWFLVQNVWEVKTLLNKPDNTQVALHTFPLLGQHQDLWISLVSFFIMCLNGRCAAQLSRCRCL